MHTMVLWGSADSPRGHLIVSPQVCIVRITIPHKAILRQFPIRIRLCVLVCVCARAHGIWGPNISKTVRDRGLVTMGHQ